MNPFLLTTRLISTSLLLVVKMSDCDRYVCQDTNETSACQINACQKNVKKSLDVVCKWMKTYDMMIENRIIKSCPVWLKMLEKTLECSDFNGLHKTLVGAKHFVAHLHKAYGENFTGLKLYGNVTDVSTEQVQGQISTIKVNLPKEIVSKNDENKMIAYCAYRDPDFFNPLEALNNETVGLSVSNTTVSGLRNPVNITFRFEEALKANVTPKCSFWDFTEKSWKDTGCRTVQQENEIICSCNHLTYFAVLLVPKSNIRLPDVVSLTYITQVGCSLSLVFLTITFILYFINRRKANDDSLKIHMNLTLALFFLNVFFLCSGASEMLKVDTLCISFAVLLHYFLLCSFFWMAVEGFHLYMLLCKVFNMYIRKYILKLCLVAWGVPAVVTILTACINMEVYGRVSIHYIQSNASNIAFCFVNNVVVRNVTILSLVFLVCLFNLVMLSITVKKIMSMRSNKVSGENRSACQDVGTVLGITFLLGTTWGLAFFSFGPLELTGIYLFTILNSLQGFFIFLRYFLSKQRASRGSATMATQSSGT
ncbi:adhesion G-protein coupled receptor G2 [Amia ocellicauda]|uniref:adhesion G-protein coupled receptor G2 n=1 Tax=Amia ocellicauda TaxID=2972642 RepID=UPI0034648E57